MGEIIAFRMRVRAARRDCEPQIGDAQILFFLGVRYMRMETPAETQDALAPDHERGPNGGKKRRTRARA